MEEHIVRIIRIEQVTHDVKRFQVEKPEGYSFIPGQATDVSINSPELRDEKRPFTFTCLNREPYLEFTIKIYPSHNGVTNELGKLKPGAELIIRDVWGAISFKGKGIFIAGGAGITPFISIFRDLRTKNEISGNTLIFANKTKADIILEHELRDMLGNSFINILSDEKDNGYSQGMITVDFLKANIVDSNRNYYLCGPPPMMDAVKQQLASLGVGENSITLEL
ncbi:MAG: FAD-binding oxidoreductase [Bacteroidia bacterium]|jgi:ferredoxin-NADP reductase|nr:FAD-binding oxidoreductase [Bacteroidia bacterium]